jgi:hypothetical protein
MSENQRAAATDAEICAKWVSMLNMFKRLTEDKPTVEKIKDKLIELQSLAMNSILTPRQVSGIYERCQNYINGSYGKNLSHLAH